MFKNTFPIILFIIILSFVVPCKTYASEEIFIPQLYNCSMKILCQYYEPIKYDESWPDLHIAIDYSVEIIKYKPESLESYFIISAIGPQINWKNDPIFKEKFLKLLNRIFDNPLENINIAENIVYLTCAFMMGDELIETPTYNITKKSIEALEKIKNEYPDRNYAALALIALCYGANNKYHNEFINKFPDHVAVPFIFLSMQFQKFINKEYDENIKSIKNIMEKYKNLKSPEGWKYEIYCYHDLIWTYWKMNDIETCQKYLKLIEEQAPGYYFLEDLRDMVKVNKNE